MPKALVNGLRLHYQRAGQGADLVLIHGLAANVAFWYLAVVPALIGEFRVTAYDLRGHGYSDTPPSGYTSADMAADLDALLDHLGVERAHLVGHSFGGAIALHHAALHPERVASLTLADPLVPALQRGRPVRPSPDAEAELRRLRVSPRRDSPEAGLELLEELASAHSPNGAADARAFMPFRAWKGSDQTAERWRSLLETTTAREDFGAVAGLTLEKIGSLRQPTLAVFGERSPWLATGRVLEETLPDCRAAVIRGVGHFHPLVRPRVFVRHLREFLTSTSDSAFR